MIILPFKQSALLMMNQNPLNSKIRCTQLKLLNRLGSFCCPPSRLKMLKDLSTYLNLLWRAKNRIFFG